MNYKQLALAAALLAGCSANIEDTSEQDLTEDVGSHVSSLIQNDDGHNLAAKFNVGKVHKKSHSFAKQKSCVKQPRRPEVGEGVPVEALEFISRFTDDPTIFNISDVDENLQAPLFVDLWSEREGTRENGFDTGAHGLFGIFPPGFSAPIHTHDADYHGVVLQGELTNPFGTELERFLDDPNADGDVVLRPGSYWFVPAGAQHSTTCRGPEVCWWYLSQTETFRFLPLPADTTAEDLVDDPESIEIPVESLDFVYNNEVPFAFDNVFGSLLTGEHYSFGYVPAGQRVPRGLQGRSVAPDNFQYGLMVSGTLTNDFAGERGAPTRLDSGGFFTWPSGSVYETRCEGGRNGEGCLFYFHSDERFEFDSVCNKKQVRRNRRRRAQSRRRHRH